MFESTKKHRVATEVKQRVPEAVIALLWQTLSDFRKQKKLVSKTIAVAFSDDYDDQTIYILVMQGNGEISEEVKLTYTGSKDFLNQGTIVIINDKPHTVNMTLSALNKQSMDATTNK